MMNALVVRKQSEASLSISPNQNIPQNNARRIRPLAFLCQTALNSLSQNNGENESKFETFNQKEQDTSTNKKSNYKKLFWKKLSKLTSSEIGLLMILLTYAFIGAAVFQAIEGPHEQEMKSEINRVKKNLIRKTWTLIKSEQSFINFTNGMENELKGYERELKKAFEHGIMAGDDKRIWDYWGSLFFSSTIFSTIGYGHISPATSAGRIVTMLYATLGIPLFFVVMANLGKFLTRCIKFLWSYARRFFKSVQLQRHIQNSHCLSRCTKSGPTPQLSESGNCDDKDELENENDYQVDDLFNLHPLVAITITIIYIFIGALVYVQWEPWTYLEAFYFIFISLSTIGFGDLVPEHPRYFLASSVYILFGLSLVAMVINVMMEFFSNTINKAKETVESISRSIGFDLETHDTTSDIDNSPRSQIRETFITTETEVASDNQGVTNVNFSIGDDE